VLILDEPTTGLDVTTQKVITRVLRDLVDREQVAALFITHDLALLAELADDLAILYAGEVVESGPAALIVSAPRHPYTRALLDAVPDPERATTPVGIPGLPPGRFVPDRCGFAERCRHRVDACVQDHPALLEIGDGRLARCVRARELSFQETRATPRTPQHQQRQPCLEIPRRVRRR
jgi:peptide/nickel transport system ATP-binding protein